MSRSRPQSNRRWTDSGEAFDDGGLKHRAEEDTRPVPIPSRAGHDPARAHRGVRDRRRWAAIQDSSRRDDLRRHSYLGSCTDTGPRSGAGCLSAGGQAYDLRHGAVSLWLNGGVTATEVANRAGHSLEVLLRVYPKCIDGGDEAANRRIDEALAA